MPLGILLPLGKRLCCVVSRRLVLPLGKLLCYTVPLGILLPLGKLLLYDGDVVPLGIILPLGKRLCSTVLGRILQSLFWQLLEHLVPLRILLSCQQHIRHSVPLRILLPCW